MIPIFEENDDIIHKSNKRKEYLHAKTPRHSVGTLCVYHGWFCVSVAGSNEARYKKSTTTGNKKCESCAIRKIHNKRH
jgi:hypothetical protein